METGGLSEGALEGALPVLDEASAAVARDLVRRTGREAGLAVVPIERLATAASELVHNQLQHARRGRLAVRAILRQGVAGVEVIAADQGPGLEHPALALAGVPVRAGLGGVLRLTDELDLDARRDEGTLVRVRVFAGPVPYRSEVAILARPAEGLVVSGDDAAFLRLGDDVAFAVADGLGHGAPARAASRAAMAVVRAQPDLPPEQLIERCGAALRGTRGAVMAAVRLRRGAARLDHACLGDVTTRLLHQGRELRPSCRPAILGGDALRAVRARPEAVPCFPGDVLLIHTDGVRARGDLAKEMALLKEHPAVLADHVLSHYGRADDDALVLVARC